MKIVISGGPGTGKTSIINELVSIGQIVFHESSREIITRYKKLGHDQLFLSDPVKFSEILLSNRIKQYKDANSFNSKNCFFDRGIPDIVAYLEYKKAAVNFAYELRTINRFENMLLPVKEGSLVVFVNPSTPDGTYYDIDTLMNYWIQRHCTILIDESFLDFCDGKSATKYIKEYDKVYILKSMTKFYSSAGIRVGTLVSNEKNIDSIKRFEPMWKLSQFDSNYLQAAL